MQPFGSSSMLFLQRESGAESLYCVGTVIGKMGAVDSNGV